MSKRLKEELQQGGELDPHAPLSRRDAAAHFAPEIFGREPVVSRKGGGNWRRPNPPAIWNTHHLSRGRSRRLGQYPSERSAVRIETPLAQGTDRTQRRGGAMTSAIPFHPLADIFPMLEPKEQMSLSDDIKAHGLREPIVMHEGKILDGRNRYQACVMAGVDPAQKDFDGPDPLAFVISANLRRRHLNDDQRALVASKIATLKKGDNQHTANAGTSRARAAALLNVSEAKVERVHKVRTKGAPELVAAVERGDVSVSAAAAVASLLKDEQTKVVAAGPAAVVEAAKKRKPVLLTKFGRQQLAEKAAKYWAERAAAKAAPKADTVTAPAHDLGIVSLADARHKREEATRKAEATATAYAIDDALATLPVQPSALELAIEKHGLVGGALRHLRREIEEAKAYFGGGFQDDDDWSTVRRTIREDLADAP